jgi:ACDE family multidrug resistance protein
VKLLTKLFGSDAEILTDQDFQALLLANTMAPLGIAVLSPILDSLIPVFGTSAADIGLMISLFTAPAIFMIPVAGILSDRYGRKPILVSSLFLFGVGGIGIALTVSFQVVLGFRLLQGIAFGGITPVLITSIGDIYEGSTETTAQGIRFMGSGFMQAIFPLVSGGIVVFAWQFPFLLYAFSIPIAGAVHLWFEDPVSENSSTNHPKISRVETKESRSLAKLMLQRNVVALVIARALPVATWVCFLTYNSILVIRVMGGTPTQAGIFVALGSLSYAITAGQTGRISAVIGSDYATLVGANICMSLGFVLFLFSSILAVAGLGIVITGVGFGLVMSLMRSIITRLPSEANRGGLVSIAESLGRVVATGTPLIMGGIITYIIPFVDLPFAVQIASFVVVSSSIIGGVICLSIASSSM